jgi:hypothetical protein
MLAPEWLEKLCPEQRESLFKPDPANPGKFLLKTRAMHFLYKFLWKKGNHLFIVGTTGSGKTQKLYWVVRWIATTRETVVWLDSAKNDEILPLLGMGHPVRLICPMGCDIEIREWSKEKRKYVRIENHPEVIQVPDAGTAWWAVKRGHINIFCFRRSFHDLTTRIEWMRELFSTLSVWAATRRMPHILPMALVGDEAHWFVAGEKITKDMQRGDLSELITELSLEDRAIGVRLVLAAQGFKNLTTGARENMINVLACRGMNVDSSENASLAKWNRRTPYFRCNEGLFIYEGGFAYPENHPWPFPYFPKPKMIVEYMGEFAGKTEEMEATEEIDTEIIPDFSKYNSLCQSLIGYEVDREISRYNIPDGGIPDDAS